MNSLASLIFFPLALLTNAWGLSFLGADVPDLSHGVNVSVDNVAFDMRTGIFTYSYQLGNPAANTGLFGSLQLDISQPIGGVVFSSAALGPGLRFDGEGADELVASGEVSVVSITAESPANWIGGIGLGNVLHWFGSDIPFDISPSSHIAGFVIRSHAPPGPRSFIAEPALDTDALPEDHFGGDTADNAVANTDALLAQLKVKGFTLGPTPPASLDPGGLIDNLISLKHQSVSQGWLRGEEFIKKLDRKLEQAKKALAQGKGFKARKKLEQFIKTLEQQRKEQEKRRHEASEKGEAEREEHAKVDKRFINDNAFFLLKANAEFIISKLPEKPKENDNDREGEKDDD